MNKRRNRRRTRPPWALVLLTTLCAELTFTAVAVPSTWLLLPLLLVMYGAADWGLRALGVNWTYWESQIGVHVVLSVLIPITIVNLLFPDRRFQPYLGNGGLMGVGALAIVGVFGLRVIISASQDPGYQTPLGWTAVFVAAIIVLALLALVVIPRRRLPERGRVRRTAPRPLVVGLVSTYLTMAFLTTAGWCCAGERQPTGTISIGSG